MGKQKLIVSRKTKKRRILASLLTVVMTAGLCSTGMMPAEKEVKAATLGFTEDFETDTPTGTQMGNPKFEITTEAHTGNGGLFVSEREQDWFAYAYDISAYAGKSIKLNAFMKVETADLLAVACVKGSANNEDFYKWATCTLTKSGEWVELNDYYAVPEGSTTLYFMTWDSAANAASKDNYYLDDVSVKQTKFMKENFDEYTDVSEKIGSVFGNPTLSLSETGVNDTKALLVSDRTENYFGYAYGDVSMFAGKTITLSASVCTPDAADDAQTPVNATIKTTKSGADDDYKQVATVTATGKEFTQLSGTYEVPAGCDSYAIYFESDANVNYIIDNIVIAIEGDYEESEEPAPPTYVDFSGYPILKELYKDYFRIGVASEAISNWEEQNKLSEIGNPVKEALIAQEFNTFTFGNELKPAYNMGYASESATETYLPFVINPSAKEMLDWAKANGMPVRGHCLVWHSQCADEAFCKEYQPVYLDENKTQLDPSCFVSREVMLQRLESYINSVMEYMYKNGYGTTIYAWDVVNEAIDTNGSELSIRNSYWSRVIGNDFIYYCFKYAREASAKYAKEYAVDYAVDPGDEAAVKTIMPKLFYNDFNEFQAIKRDAIIHILTADVEGHNIKAEGLIDGVGMQGHVTDTTSIETYVEALRMYDEAIGEVHITELDVTQTSSGANAEYYQAVFFKNFFKALIDEVKNGVNLTSVTIWGLTDDNSWKKQDLPLLFNGDLSKKMAFDGMVYAVTGEELPEPEYVAPDFSDMNIEFETAEDVEGFTPRGDGVVSVQSEVTYDGTGALLDSGRTATWNGASFDVSRFAGQTIAVSGWVKTAAPEAKISADIDGVWPNIATADTSSGKWVQLTGTYKIPAQLTALKLYFETSDTSDIYIDHVKVKLVGLDEGFEDEANICGSRGVGHVPVITVTDTVSHNAGGHSLLVNRAEQDANVSINVSKYIGYKVLVKAFVKTEDAKVRFGLDGDTPVQLTEVATTSGEWTEVSAIVDLPNTLKAANLYLETDGNADFYVDDISVRIQDYEDDVEGETLNFTTRWGGAGTIAKVEDGEGNHAAVLTERSESYFGIVWDVSAYLGMEVEVSLDVKTDDANISVTGDINNVWPNYINVPSDPGKYKNVKAIINLPNDLTALKMYVETDGNSDLYVDNLKVRRVQIGEEKEKEEPTPTVTPTVTPAPTPGGSTGGSTDGSTGGGSGVSQPITLIDSKDIVIDLTKNATGLIKSEDFRSYLETAKKVVVQFTNKDGKESYRWTFQSPKDLKKVTYNDINLQVSCGNSSSIGYRYGKLLTIKQDGKLPVAGKLQIKVSSKEGTKLYLYGVDSATKKLLCVPNSSYVVDKDGYVTLNIAAGGQYVLLAKVSKNSEKLWLSKQIIKAQTMNLAVGEVKSAEPQLPPTLLKVSSMAEFDKENKAMLGVVISYQSSNEEVATVSSDGSVSAKAPGEAVITTVVKFSNGLAKSFKTSVYVK